MFLLLGVSLRYFGGSLFSPGSLSAADRNVELLNGFESHAAFEDDCSLCHEPWRGATSDRCETCHLTVAEQRRGGNGLHGILPQTNNCSPCHTEHLGSDAVITKYELASFEHGTMTEFTLDKHKVDFDSSTIDCGDCHGQGEYLSDYVNCLECHRTAEPDFMDQHLTLYGEVCLACHDGRDSMVDFDHESVFPLEGAHAVVECVACHQDTILAGTPNQCSGCHQEPDIHAGLFGQDCIRCHTVVAWIPAQLSYHTFPLDHGRDTNSPCQTCHIQSYSQYTCYQCHEHEVGEIREKHIEEGITDFIDCIACHPTGLEHEGEGAEDD